MLKDQADQVLAALSSRFRGRQIEVLTRGNDDAREAGIPQHYTVRTHFGMSGGESSLDGEAMAALLEVAKDAATEKLPIEISTVPVDRGTLEIRVVLE